MSEARYEMLWDCPRCDTPKLLGLTHRYCPNCGAPQDPARRYYPKDDEKVAVGDHPYVGRDRQCPACEAPNAAKATHCTTCGRDLGDAGEVKTRAAQLAGESGFAADSAKAAKEELRRKPPEEPPPPKAKTGLIFGSIGCMVVAALGAVAVVAVALLLFWTKPAGVTVKGHAWARSIEVESFQTVSGSAWKDEIPAGARVGACSKEQRGSKDVADGQECHTRRVDKGDGSFTEEQECKPKTKSEAVMAEKCKYEVEKWATTRKLESKGSGLTPAWPSATLKTGTCLGCEREGKRSERYSLELSKDGGGSAECELPQAKWAAIADGSKWEASASVLTGSIDCEKMKAR